MNFDQRFCWIVRAASRKSLISQVLDFLVPAEGIEPPTFGLQNRCSTAELSRQGLPV
jgi:hypothetical protein